MRPLRSIAPWAILALALVALILWLVPNAHRTLILNVLSLGGILLLAIPTIRVNEQGRLIENVKKLQIGIRDIEAALEEDREIKEADRRLQENDLKNRKETLQSNLDQLTKGKGAWTTEVHYTLYAGYVFVLSAAVARVLT